MKSLPSLVIVLPLSLMPALVRAGQSDEPAAPQAAERQSTVSRAEVKPRPPVITQRDAYEGSSFFHPFLRIPMYVLRDQKAIWTSPLRTAKSDVKWWAIFGGATAAFIATDQWTVKALHNSDDQIAEGTWGSRLGSAYSLIPISSAFYFAGTATHEERLRETGVLGFETMIDTALVDEAVKIVTDRARPLEAGGKGRFEDSPHARWNSGFPSGHALSSWAMASLIAHQYPHPRIVPILAYGLASVVVISRVGARQHFPGDVVAGSAIGWLIGDFVYGKRHDRDLDRKPAIARRILSRIRIGTTID